MRQIVYFSTASGRQDAEAVAALLALSRDPQRYDKITGVLVAGGNRYLQAIEGPKSTVAGLLKAIRRDQCHLGVTVLVNRNIETRSFAGPMAHFAEADLVPYATLKQLIDQVRARTVDRRLHEQIDCLERRFTIAQPTPRSTPWTVATSYAAGLTLDRSH